MRQWYTYLFHKLSKQHSRGRMFAVSSNPREWPDAWHVVHYKSYPRLPKVTLEKGDLPGELSTMLEKRRSDKAFSAYTITPEELGTLLYHSCGITNTAGTRRRYPSGGALFPVEIYLCLFKPIGAIESGVYHYSAVTHELTILEERSFEHDVLEPLSFYKWLPNAQALVLCTGVFERAMQKYGYRGYRNTFLEAGHIGQNISLVSTALGMKHNIMTGLIDEKWESILDIDGVTESVVYAIAIGR